MYTRDVLCLVLSLLGLVAVACVWCRSTGLVETDSAIIISSNKLTPSRAGGPNSRVAATMFLLADTKTVSCPLARFALYCERNLPRQRRHNR